MITFPPVVLSSQVKLAVVLEVPAGLFNKLMGAPGTIGVKTVEPVPACESSESPIMFVAIILAKIYCPSTRENGWALRDEIFIVQIVF